MILRRGHSWVPSVCGHRTLRCNYLRGEVIVLHEFYIEGIKIVGFVCDARGRSPESPKIAKVLGWELCHDLAGARAFIRLCIYYRIWVKHFTIVAAPISRLFP